MTINAKKSFLMDYKWMCANCHYDPVSMGKYGYERLS